MRGGAPERILGVKLLPQTVRGGKLTPKDCHRALDLKGDKHCVQPRMISITQPTEYGILYTLEEIKELSGFAHSHGLFLHMDGARIANAVASMNIPIREMTIDAGVDSLSFGGTKNGQLFGEAAIIFHSDFKKDLEFYRKNMMQLYSKMRFVSCQFLAMLEGDLWLKNARNSNTKAKLLASRLLSLEQVKICYPVETNCVIAQLDRHSITKLQEASPFYVWNETENQVRWMASFDTTDEDIHNFVDLIISHSN